MAKVYLTKSLKYGSLENGLSEFCLENDLMIKWQTGRAGAKGYLYILDLTEREDIKDKVFEFIGGKCRITNRSNLVLAKNEYNAYLYREGLRPAYSADSRDKNEVEKKSIGDKYLVTLPDDL